MREQAPQEPKAAPTQEQEDLMTSYETCDFLRVSYATLYRYIRARKIPFMLACGSYRFSRQKLMAWMEERGCDGDGKVVAEITPNSDGIREPVSNKTPRDTLAKLKAIKAEALKNGVSHA